MAGGYGAIWGDAGCLSTASAAFVELAVLASRGVVEVLATILGEVPVIASGLLGGGWA